MPKHENQAALSADQVRSALPGGWQLVSGRIAARYQTGSFTAGVSFIAGISDLAETANHHPDVDLRYAEVTVTLISHDVQALTGRDVGLAKQIHQLSQQLKINIDPSFPDATGDDAQLVSMDQYQLGALRTAAAREKKNELLHLVLGLVGESGEVAEKFKKWVRDLDSDESRLDRADIGKELGDVLWYVAVLADYLDLSLADIAKANLEKLASRKARQVLSGSGDNR